jgi:hypothetical protein
MANLHPIQFADTITSNPKLRERFITAYVDGMINSMDTDDIMQAYAKVLYDEIESDIRNNGPDGAVEDAVWYVPDIMENEFGVKNPD